jgi:hypothetical protein
MSYLKGFVLSTKLSNSDTFLKEIRKDNEPTVYMPFGSEYSIFLKNKTLSRAKFKVKLDGKYVHPENNAFVINANSSFNLERFLLDGDLNKGEKFKFVNVEGSGEEPGADENGLIEVKINIEKVSRYLSDDIFGNGDHIRCCGSKIYNGNSNPNVMFKSSLNRSYDTNAHDSSSLGFCEMDSVDLSDEGVTVGGSQSTQSFIDIPDFETESEDIILKLRIKPVKESKSTDKICIGCDGLKKQRNNDGIWILCPICEGSGIWNGQS